MGLYGVVAYSVTRRTPEIGIRLALGARPAQVLALILREVFGLVAVGVAIGLPAAYALGHLLAAQLFGVQPNDVPIFAAGVAVILAAAFLASFLPAHRASLTDPKQALRYE